MISVYGSSIMSAYVYGTRVIEIYNYGIRVWPDYYVQWTPSDLSTGTFSLNGSTYNFSDYSGSILLYSGVVDTYAFMDTEITGITTNATSIDAGAFRSCYNLSQVSLPVCSYISHNAFVWCRSLSQISLPVCSYIGDFAFSSCSSLLQVSLPACKYIGVKAFDGCRSLSQINLPACSSIDNGAFHNCDNLSQVSLPVCKYISDGAFQGCDILSQISLPVCSYIAKATFWDCISLRKITLGYSYVCVLDDPYTNVFRSTPIESGTGSIYVPSSLVNAYKSAQYWSQYASRIFAIPS